MPNLCHRQGSMTKVQESTLRKTLTVEPTVKKNLTVATSRIPWRPVIALLAGIVVMSVVVPSEAQLKHVPPAASSYMVLYSLKGAEPGGTDGSGANGLTRDAAGNLYVTTAYGFRFGCLGLECGTIFKLTPTGTETLLFSNYGKDTPPPNAGLVLDAASNLYGTIAGHDCPFDWCGAAFKLDPTGTTFTDLHSFDGGADGGSPAAGLIRDGAGNLYGTTLVGGALGASCYGLGCGTVFRLSPSGTETTETVLYNFTGADGAGPSAELLRDSVGNLYGTTAQGGHQSGACNLGNEGNGTCGVVFELIRCDSEPSGYEYKVLYRFTGGRDGGNPVSGLVRDASGNLYGTTLLGGANSSVCIAFESGVSPTCGVVFKLSPTGALPTNTRLWSETVLHTFTGGWDGGNPLGPDLIQDLAGNLYGTAYLGGVYFAGVVFRLAP